MDAVPILERLKRPLKWIAVLLLGFIILLAVIVSIIVSIYILTAPSTFHYEIVATKLDPATKKVIEIARVYPDVADHIWYNVYIYPDVDPDRSYSVFAPLLFAFQAEDTPAFDKRGDCYVLTAKFWETLPKPESWKDDDSGQSICFAINPQ